MEIDPHNLPADRAVLQQMVRSLLEELNDKERRFQRVQHLLEQLLRWRYGQKRERVDENQLFLFAAAIIGSGQQVAPHPEEPIAPSSGEGSEARLRSPKARATAGSGCRNRWSGGGWYSIWASRNSTARSARAS